MLNERFGSAKKSRLKALIAAALLEGVDLSRKNDFGRDVVRNYAISRANAAVRGEIV